MKRHNSIQINIPKPCHEDWSKMTPQEQGRFCSKCQTCVTDFTEFTDEQLYKFIAEHKGQKLCGRFLSTQLNRPIYLPPQPHSQLYKWIIAAGLALIFTVNPGSNTFAKAPFTVTQLSEPGNNDDTTSNNDSITISGVILDDRNEPLVYATIQVYSDSVLICGTLSDFDGKFSCKTTKRQNLSLKVNYVGYKTTELSLEEFNKQQQQSIMLHPSPSNMTTGDIIIIDNNKPLLDPYEGGQSETFSSDDIERAAH